MKDRLPKSWRLRKSGECLFMPRRTIPFMPNQYYHFYNRGNNRQPVFFERDNYLYFLRGIKKYLGEAVDILAYCLMPTHYHILLNVLPQTSEVFKTSEVYIFTIISHSAVFV